MARNARAEAFDAAIAAADDLIRATPISEFHPEMQPDIPGIFAINERAFLPNIRDGRVYLTRRQQQGDGIPVIPLLNHSEKLIVDRPAMLPTASHIEHVATLRNINSDELKKYIFANNAPTKKIGLSKPTTYGSTLTTLRRITTPDNFRKSDPYVLSRPIILLAPSLFRETSAVIGGITIHEELHAWDDEHEVPRPIFVSESDQLAANRELRAHHVGAVAMQTAYEKFPDNETLKNHHSIENLRDAAEPHSSGPFEAIPDVVAVLKLNGTI